MGWIKLKNHYHYPLAIKLKGLIELLVLLQYVMVTLLITCMWNTKNERNADPVLQHREN
jgi:hypothetical protein